MSSFDNSKKLSFGALFLSRLLSIITDGWRVSNNVLFLKYVNGSLKQLLHWNNMFISSPTKIRKSINGDFTGFDLPKYLIYDRTTYSIHWPFSVVGLDILPLKNDAGIIARSKCESKFWPKLYCTVQCTVLQWSLPLVTTVTKSFAVFNKIATASKNTKRFKAK